MDIYTFINHCRGLNLLILPPAISSPRGMENNKVSKNISIEVIIPSQSWDITVLKIIYYSPLLLKDYSVINEPGTP